MSKLSSLFGISSNEDYSIRDESKESSLNVELKKYSYKFDDGNGTVSGHSEVVHGDTVHCTDYYQSGDSRGIRESWDRDKDGNISGYHITDQDDKTHWDEEKGDH